MQWCRTSFLRRFCQRILMLCPMPTQLRSSMSNPGWTMSLVPIMSLMDRHLINSDVVPIPGESLRNTITLQGMPNHHSIGTRSSPITVLVLRTCISSTHLLLLSVTGRITNSVRKQAASSAYSARWEGQDASYSLGVGPS
jgi:hypothetical protein